MKRWSVWVLLAIILAGLVPVQGQAVELNVPGKSAVLMDMATGTVLYAANEHAPLPPASVTKVMTLLLIMEAIDSGRITWDQPVTASEAAAAKGGSQIYLKAGETLSVADMVKSIAVSSANDCACAMAEHLAGSEAAFVDAMNTRASELGMQDTHFVNCTGLDDEENAREHVTSAYDIAIMSRQLMLYHPDIQKYTTIWMDTVRDGAFGLSNTNKLIRFYSGATGLKTGFTAKAGYCLSATAQRDGMGVIAVVMGCETSQDRFAACKGMLDYAFANYALVTPELPQTATVPVTLGTASQVAAVPADAGALLVDKGQRSQITTEVTLEPEVTAPVSLGQRLGTMTVRCGQQVLKEIPLVAEESVPKLTFWQLFWQIIQKVSMAKDASAVSE